MKNLLLAALLLTSLPAAAQQTDSLKTTLPVAADSVADKDDDDNFSHITRVITWSRLLRHTSTKRNDRWSMHFQAGFNAPVGVSDGVHFAPFRSAEIMWTVFQYDYMPKHTTQTYSIGLGLSWHNYTLKNTGEMFVRGVVDTKSVELGTFPEGASHRYSRIHTASVSVPVLFNQRLGRRTSLSFGGVINFNYLGELCSGYRMGDDRIDIVHKGIAWRPVTFDLMAIAHIYDVGIFFKYTPFSVLKSDRGPEVKSLSLGLYF